MRSQLIVWQSLHLDTSMPLNQELEIVESRCEIR